MGIVDDKGPAVTTAAQALYEAAHQALAAPSIFNSQPWRWVVLPDALQLWADRSRQLASVDPQGRLLTLSCGAAAHHAMAAVAGHPAELTLSPDADEPDLMAVLRLREGEPPLTRRNDLRPAISLRRTDRRAFQKTPIGGKILDRLVAACHEHGAHLYLVPGHQMPALALAAVSAGALQLSDPAYRMELADWTHRPPWSGDGVPLQTAVKSGPRRVPVRDFAPFGGATMPPGLDNDFGATYAAIYTDADCPADWLAAGAALSAVLLTATAFGLATATISDVTEAPVVREQLRQLLPTGYPQIALRIGHPQAGDPPSTPRRPAEEVITVAA